MVDCLAFSMAFPSECPLQLLVTTKVCLPSRAHIALLFSWSLNSQLLFAAGPAPGLTLHHILGQQREFWEEETVARTQPIVFNFRNTQGCTCDSVTIWMAVKIFSKGGGETSLWNHSHQLHMSPAKNPEHRSVLGVWVHWVWGPSSWIFSSG